MRHVAKCCRVECITVGLVAALMSLPSAVVAETGLDLARENKCLACHQVDKRRVGPPFNAVAERFGGQQGAAEYLAGVIQNGGRGQWGAIPMPAQSHVNDAQAMALAQWILSLQGDAPSAGQ